MKASKVQGFIAEQIRQSPELSEVGLHNAVVVENGTYPKTPNREAALERFGCVILVWRPAPVMSIGESRNGTNVHFVSCPVIIEADPARCQQKTGFNYLEIMELVVASTLGKGGGNGNNPIVAGDPPWSDFGTVEGVTRTAINFQTKDAWLP